MSEVFVNRRRVGTLSRGEPTHRFAYEVGVPESLAVSLLMSVAGSSYPAERLTVLHPVFDMNLPEGALREALNQLFAKALPVFDDLALLEIVGRSLIGRLRFGASAEHLDEVPSQNLRELLSSRGTDGLFADLLRRYARYSGVAGVQPKLLIRDDGTLGTSKFSPVPVGDRLTARGTTHIVKSFDAVKHPGLASNEFLCLKAARLAGLPVPPVEIASGGHLLIVERFDLKPDGSYLAFEDGCALDGRLSREKYVGSYEQLASTLTGTLRGSDGTATQLAQFFRALALMLDGTKRWPDAKRLVRFARQRCLLTEKAAKEIVAEVIEAVDQVSHDLKDLTELDPRAGEIADRMRTAWAQGIASLKV
jgi:serine/threonine-protein kinase HipA